MNRSFAMGLAQGHAPALTGGINAAPYAHKSVVFDGTNNYLTRGANMTGMPNNSFLTTIYAKFRVSSLATNQRLVSAATGGAATFNINITTAGDVTVNWIGNYGSSASLFGGITAGQTYHLIFQVDTYFDYYFIDLYPAGSVVASSHGDGTATNPGDVISYTDVTNWAVGASSAGTLKFNGVIYALAVYTDNSGYTADSFIYTTNLSGNDVDLGNNGLLSGMSFCRLFFGGRQTADDRDSNPPQGWNDGFNQGSGGAFTMVNYPPGVTNG